jgi:hypothetical protein
VTSSWCHWITSGSIGSGPNSGSASAASRLATSAAPISGPAAAGATVPAWAVASSWAPRQTPSVGVAWRTALRSNDSSWSNHGARSVCTFCSPPSTTSAA